MDVPSVWQRILVTLRNIFLILQSNNSIYTPYVKSHLSVAFSKSKYQEPCIKQLPSTNNICRLTTKPNNHQPFWRIVALSIILNVFIMSSPHTWELILNRSIPSFFYSAIKLCIKYTLTLYLSYESKIQTRSAGEIKLKNQNI